MIVSKLEYPLRKRVFVEDKQIFNTTEDNAIALSSLYPNLQFGVNIQLFVNNTIFTFENIREIILSANPDGTGLMIIRGSQNNDKDTSMCFFYHHYITHIYEIDSNSIKIICYWAPADFMQDKVEYPILLNDHNRDTDEYLLSLLINKTYPPIFMHDSIIAKNKLSLEQIKNLIKNINEKTEGYGLEENNLYLVDDCGDLAIAKVTEISTAPKDQYVVWVDENNNPEVEHIVNFLVNLKWLVIPDVTIIVDLEGCYLATSYRYLEKINIEGPSIEMFDETQDSELRKNICIQWVNTKLTEYCRSISEHYPVEYFPDINLYPVIVLDRHKEVCYRTKVEIKKDV